jgi:5-methylcytosine-specific restriction endonuclease McrA
MLNRPALCRGRPVARALKACATPGCANLTRESYCPECKPPAWQRSTPRTTLSGWVQQKRAPRILRLNDEVCHVCGLGGTDQVDHVIPISEGCTDADENLRPIHGRPCHEQKTLAEAQRARARNVEAPQLRTRRRLRFRARRRGDRLPSKVSSSCATWNPAASCTRSTPSRTATDRSLRSELRPASRGRRTPNMQRRAHDLQRDEARSVTHRYPTRVLPLAFEQEGCSPTHALRRSHGAIREVIG